MSSTRSVYGRSALFASVGACVLFLLLISIGAKLPRPVGLTAAIIVMVLLATVAVLMLLRIAMGPQRGRLLAAFVSAVAIGILAGGVGVAVAPENAGAPIGLIIIVLLAFPTLAIACLIFWIAEGQERDIAARDG